MGADMLIRTLYLPTNTTINLAAAKAVASQLSRNATLDDLRLLLEHAWIIDDTLPDPDHCTDDDLAAHAGNLRQLTEQELHTLLDRLTASLHSREVHQHRFSRDDQPGLDAYTTGGLSYGDSPTEAFEAWDVVFDDDRFPDGWTDQLGAAAGLLHPWGTGPAAATVALHTWARPAVAHPSTAAGQPTTASVTPTDRFTHLQPATNPAPEVSSSRIIDEIDRGPRTVGGIEVTIVEVVWQGEGRSFEVYRVDTGADLTVDGCFDTWPTDEQIAALLHPAEGWWSCPGCGAQIVASQADLIVDHVRDCDRVDGAGQPTSGRPR